MGKLFHFWRSISNYELLISLFCSSLVRLGHNEHRLLGPATYLPHKDGGIPLSVAQGHNKQACRLIFHTIPYCAECQAGKLRTQFLKVFWYNCTWKMNPRSTDCEETALITTSSRRLIFISFRFTTPVHDD